MIPRFVSLDNPCPYQQNLHRFLKQAGIKRKDIILWNTMPWLTPSGKNSHRPAITSQRCGNNKVTDTLTEEFNRCRSGWFGCLTNPSVFEREYPHLTLLTMPHPSPLSLCRSPSVTEAIKTTLHRAYILINSLHAEVKDSHIL